MIFLLENISIAAQRGHLCNLETAIECVYNAPWIVSYWNLLSSLIYPGNDTINIFAGLFTKTCLL